MTAHSGQGSDGGSTAGCGNPEGIRDLTWGANKAVEEGRSCLKPGLVRMSQEKVLRHDGFWAEGTTWAKGRRLVSRQGATVNKTFLSGEERSAQQAVPWMLNCAESL